MNANISLDGRSCKLRNGVVFPKLGIGTFPVNKSFTDEEYVQSLKHALKIGYRHIDSSRCYNNEHLIAQTIKESGLKREDLFIASDGRTSAPSRASPSEPTSSSNPRPNPLLVMKSLLKAKK